MQRAWTGTSSILSSELPLLSSPSLLVYTASALLLTAVLFALGFVLAGFLVWRLFLEAVLPFAVKKPEKLHLAASLILSLTDPGDSSWGYLLDQ